MADGKVTIEALLDSKRFQKGIDNLAKSSKTGLKTVSAGIAASATALTAASGVAIKAGIAFESAFAGVKKTVDATDEELKQLEQGIRNLAKEMPTAANEIAGVAEAAGQLGIKTENILGFTKTMTMLGDATNLSADEAATALARLANITGMSQRDFDKLGSTIVALGNNLATTESEIVAMGMRIAGAGKQVGLTEAQIMSFAGALSSVGIEAEAGGTAFSKLISQMSLATQKGGKELDQFAKVAGMSSADFKQAFEKDASKAIIAFIKGLDNVKKQGGSAIKVLDEMGLSDIRMRDALLRASGASDVFTNALQIGTEAWEENTALTKEAEQRYKTLESRINIFKNKLTDIGISIYKDVNSPLSDMVDGASKAADKLSEAFSKKGFKGFAGAVGEVLSDALVAITSKAPAMIEAGGQMLKSVVVGLYNNRGKLIEAAGNLVVALATAFGALLPKEIGNALKGLAKGVVAVIKPALSLAGALVKVAGAIAPLIPYILGAVGAFKAYQKIMVGVSAVKGFISTQKLISAGLASANTQLAIGKVHWAINTAAIKLNSIATTYAAAKKKAMAAAQVSETLAAATGTKTIVQGTIATQAYSVASGVAAVATKAFSAAMSFLGGPIGVVVAAIGAIGAGLLILAGNSDKARVTLAETAKKSAEAFREARQAYEDARKQAEEKIATGMAELTYVDNLKSKLYQLVDANGKVKEGYEAQVSYILGELKEATGIEIAMKDGIIQSYDKVKGAIDGYIAKKKAELILEARKDVYIESIKARDKAVKSYEDAIKRRSELLAEATRQEQTWGYVSNTTKNDIVKNANDIKEATESMSQSEKDAAVYNETLKNVSVGNYEAVAQSAEGTANKIKDLSKMKVEDLKTEVSQTKQELGTLKNIHAETGDEITAKKIEEREKYLAEVQAKLNGESTAMTAQAPILRQKGEELAKNALSGLASNLGLFKQDGANKASNVAKGISANKSVVNASASKAREAANTMNSYRSSFWGVGQNIVAGVSGGMNGQSLIARATSLARNALNAMKSALGIHSPSRVFRDEVGKQISAGVAVGIEQNADLATNAVDDLTSGLFDKLSLAEIDNLCGQMEATVFHDLSRKPVSYALTQEAKLESGLTDEDRTYNINLATNIDGKKVAEATAVYNDRALSDLNSRRERGQF